MFRPDVSLIISTYQMPEHLRRVLVSVAQQTALSRMEIIVADDGSRDNTREIVEEFSRTVAVPVKFITHPHAGFHLTRCRNEGAQLATAPYLLFLDGDCLLPPNHVAEYLAYRRRRYVHFGFCARLDRETSLRMGEPEIISGVFERMVPREEMQKLASMHRKALLYQWLRHPSKPALKGGNLGIWKTDFELLNGFDENFQAWGCEDDDLSLRARTSGLRIASMLGVTRTYHLWHAPTNTKPLGKWREGPNVPYFLRRGRLPCCLNGLRKRDSQDIKISIRGMRPPQPEWREELATQFAIVPAGKPAEVEVLCYPSRETFSAHSHCRVLLAESNAPEHVVRTADVQFTSPGELVDSLHDFLRGSMWTSAPRELACA